MVNKIEDRIYKVREQYIMLDFDLAKIFGVETKRINEAASRNKEKFLDQFTWKITKEEFSNLKSQFATSNGVFATLNEHSGSRKSYTIFTLEGIKILSTILKKSNVQSVTEEIIRAFMSVESKNNQGLTIPVSKKEKIESLIYEIRGKQVMLDYDLARVYECKNGTKTINLAVKRHPNMFKSDIYFQLTEEEFFKLRFQTETANQNMMSRTLPFAFTEEGVYMLATKILERNLL